MSFGNWSEETHKEFEQIKRIVFSHRIKPENVTINATTQSAKIVGTDGIYDVTLNSCTCFDFYNRQMPCKHIYRLAYELGYLDDLPTQNRKAVKEFKNSLPAEIEHFKELYFKGAISGEKLNKIVNALTSK